MQVIYIYTQKYSINVILHVYFYLYIYITVLWSILQQHFNHLPMLLTRGHSDSL